MNPLNYQASDRPKVDGVRGFKDSESEHTPLNTPNSKLAQNRATWKEPHGAGPEIVNYPPPGGRIAVKEGFYKPSKTLHTSMQYSREGNRVYEGTEAKGRVIVSTNHPNKNINKHYG